MVWYSGGYLISLAHITGLVRSARRGIPPSRLCGSTDGYSSPDALFLAMVLAPERRFPSIRFFALGTIPLGKSPLLVLPWPVESKSRGPMSLLAHTTAGRGFRGWCPAPPHCSVRMIVVGGLPPPPLSLPSSSNSLTWLRTLPGLYLPPVPHIKLLINWSNANSNNSFLTPAPPLCSTGESGFLTTIHHPISISKPLSSLIPPPRRDRTYRTRPTD